MTIGDPNASSRDALTIQLSNKGAGGTLTGPGLSGGQNGLYTLATDTAANVTTALDALVFTPAAGTANSQSTTGFTLTDQTKLQNGNGPSTSDNTTAVTNIDPPGPALSSVAASGPGIANGNGDLNAGKTVTFTVNSSKPVFVAGGTPTLALDDGGTATYAAGSGTSALQFSYTVAAGQNSPDLRVTGTALHGATIRDAVGNPFDLASAAVNPAGMLQIDTVAPLVVITSTGGLTNQAAQTISGTVDVPMQGRS